MRKLQYNKYDLKFTKYGNSCVGVILGDRVD
jgi:hypothetical protein